MEHFPSVDGLRGRAEHASGGNAAGAVETRGAAARTASKSSAMELPSSQSLPAKMMRCAEADGRPGYCASSISFTAPTRVPRSTCREKLWLGSCGFLKQILTILSAASAIGAWAVAVGARKWGRRPLVSHAKAAAPSPGPDR